jgi:hypothetical protein
MISHPRHRQDQCCSARMASHCSFWQTMPCTGIRYAQTDGCCCAATIRLPCHTCEKGARRVRAFDDDQGQCRSRSSSSYVVNNNRTRGRRPPRRSVRDADWVSGFRIWGLGFWAKPKLQDYCCSRRMGILLILNRVSSPACAERTRTNAECCRHAFCTIRRDGRRRHAGLLWLW